MYRGRLLAISVSLALLMLGVDLASAQTDKPILGKSIGEWIKILQEHENPKWRRAALKALDYSNNAGTTGLPSILQAAEKDKDSEVRREAVIILGRLGPMTKGVLKLLVTSLQTDKTDEVREAAATAIGTKFADPAQDYIGVLAEAMKDPHAGTRLAVASTLRNMKDNAKPAVPALISAAKNRKEQFLVRAVAVHVISRQAKDNSQTVPLLVEILLGEDEPLPVREAAAEGLGISANDEGVAALGKTLESTNLELRKTASAALSTLGIKAKLAWPAVKLRLTEKLEPNSSIRNHLIRLSGVLAKEKLDAIPVLTDLALKDDSTENRIAAIQELGELGTLANSSLKAISNIATQDARAAVREAAEKAAKQIKGL